MITHSDFPHLDDPSDQTMSFDEMANTRHHGPASNEMIAIVGSALWGDRWQSEMARALGVHKDTVQDWRQGRSEPKPGVWFDLIAIVEERQTKIGGVLYLLKSKIPQKF